ncbi:hypothetical protein KIH39_15985 [Telmatocola sphagniphila]|uniref:Uncharacterized protein n=1 Tax=Telmatocola sphagniphila TaxID=1123043 RepID=A0A8E6B4Q4_9BACT|nr:hypothetical protein [Telmatocola sphagniphila]QVL30350.1 hypothetical protein KIH39_15985 [Telmatocola sphagniphila]
MLTEAPAFSRAIQIPNTPKLLRLSGKVQDTQGNGAKIQIYETPAELAQIEPLYVFVYVKTGYDFSSENASRSP